MIDSLYFWFIATLLGLKLLLNISLPYGMLYHLARTGSDSTTASPMFLVEFGLAGLATALSPPISEQFGVSQLAIGGICVGLIVISYVHLAVVGFLGAWMLSLIRKHSGEDKS